MSRELGGHEVPVSDDESLRYTFFQPDAVVTTTDKTLARRVFQKAVPDYVPNIADSKDLKEPPKTTKGMVAAIPCFIDGEQDTPEGVLNVSSRNTLNGPQLEKLKEEMGKLARLCGYASQIGKLREATESTSN